VTANIEIATRKVVSPRIRETRTNIDFVEHIDTTTSDDPDGRWVFVADHLDPHKSEEWVRYVAAAFTSEQDLHDKLLAFIDYFNAVLAKPCRWTYPGEPVAA